MIDKEITRKLVEEKLAASANYLVDVQVSSDNLIVVEIDNDKSVSIDDCIDLSRYIEANLNREIEDYELEVSSAGLTAPFKILRQYTKNVGNEVELLLQCGVKQIGILKAADEKGIALVVEKQVKPEGAKRKAKVLEEQNYTFDQIKHVKRVLRFK
jgi:ribosome maturation factor RimP